MFARRLATCNQAFFSVCVDLIRTNFDWNFQILLESSEFAIKVQASFSLEYKMFFNEIHFKKLNSLQNSSHKTLICAGLTTLFV